MNLYPPPPAPLTPNGFNQLLSVSSAAGGLTSFTYDGNGNQVTRTDAAGTTTYAYNLDNRLASIAAPGGVSTFEYDANGLRTKKSDSTGTRSYLLDGLSVVAEYAPDASRLAWYTQSLARIDEVLNVVNGQGKFWYETDALGSTYAMTNATGAVVSRSSYDVFGERALVSANDVGQPFGFTGREQDASGLVYARDRFFSPATGGWTQADRILEGATRTPRQLVNPHFAQAYRYVSDQPTRFVDPAGLAPVAFPDTVKAFLFRLMIRREYAAIIAFLEGMGLNAMRRGQAIQQLLQEWTAAGAARIIPAGGATGGAAYRVADFLDDAANVLVELKFVNSCNFPISSQIRDFAMWAQQNGYRMVLVIRNSELIRPGVAARLQRLNVTVVELADYVADLVEMAQIGGA